MRQSKQRMNDVEINNSQTGRAFSTRCLLAGAVTLGLVMGCSNAQTSGQKSAQNNTQNSTQNNAQSSTQNSGQTGGQNGNGASSVRPQFSQVPVASFDEPWAMVALPAGADATVDRLLVTQKTGELFVVDLATGEKTQVAGVPAVAYGGQGGLGDVAVAPDFATSQRVYLSFAEEGSGAQRNHYGARVVQARLVGLDEGKPQLAEVATMWRQSPKVTGQGHYSHRLLFSPDGLYLYISSGDRQKKTPAQDMGQTLGKIIRLTAAGSVPEDNPFVGEGELAGQVWTLGHRNVLGMDFDADGNLWAHEMGPRGGDELNLIEAGQNYGWPEVSNGRNYSGLNIPDHDTRPEFAAPATSWNPVISPSDMQIYAGEDFAAWRGAALVSGLSSEALVVVDLNAQTGQASERYRYDMGNRIRAVLTLDGAVYVLEDGSGGQLLRLQPE